MDSIAILDFGSQYAQIIARRVREAQVYCELFPWDAPMEKILAIQPKGFILSGGPKSVYEEGAPYIQDFIFKTGLPILGICYGMQALTHALGGQVDPSAQREYGPAEIEPLSLQSSTLQSLHKSGCLTATASRNSPKASSPLAASGNSPFAAMGDMQRKYFGVQFHPEVHHTPNGEKLLKHFVVEICGVKPNWTPASIIEESVDAFASRWERNACWRRSPAVWIHRLRRRWFIEPSAINWWLFLWIRVCCGRMKASRSLRHFGEIWARSLLTVDASDEFFSALKGVTEPEEKRKIVGEKFIRVFERQAKAIGSAEVSGAGDDLSGCGRVLGAGPEQSRKDQDAS